MAMTDKELKDFLKTYNDRLQYGLSTYEKKFLDMEYSVVASKGKMPEDIKPAASNDKDEYSNMFLAPALQIVNNQLMKEVSMREPQLDLRGNNLAGDAVRDEFDAKMKQFLSFNNFGYKSKIGYWFGFYKGTIVQKSKFSVIKEFYAPLDDGTVQQPLAVGGSVDFEYFDPQQTIVDPECSPFDIAGTARWGIITLGLYSKENLESRFNVTLDDVKKKSKTPTYSMSGAYTGNANDQSIITQESLAGKDDTNERIPLRLYNTASDGKVYLIVGDSRVIREFYSDTGVIDRLCFNVCPLRPDPQSAFGMTNWEVIKYCVAIVSRATNQILDNNDKNNGFPLAVLGGANALPTMIGTGDQSFAAMELQSNNPNILDVRQIIQKFQFPEVTQGAMFLINFGNQLINMLTGVTPASMGLQAKQMRTTAEASIYQQAILSNSSEVVLNIENAHINPIIWDILRIFRRNFSAFDWKNITLNDLYQIKNVHVANGSTLAVDKISRGEMLQGMLQLMQVAPGACNTTNIVKDYAEYIGAEPERHLILDGSKVRNMPQVLNQVAQNNAAAV